MSLLRVSRLYSVGERTSECAVSVSLIDRGTDVCILRFSLYKRCIFAAGCVTARHSPIDGDHQPTGIDAQVHCVEQLHLRCYPEYQIWAPHIQDDGEIQWRWDPTAPVVDTLHTPKITFEGGEGVCLFADMRHRTLDLDSAYNHS